jgi:hypothetical protein
MKQQSRYNGRVGLYPTNRIEQFKVNWSPSWGPTPIHWYSTDDKDFQTDFGSIKKDFVGYIAPGSYTYSTTKNSLSVASPNSNTTFETSYTPDSIGYNTTSFVVIKPPAFSAAPDNVIQIASYQPSATPLITGASSITIGKTGYIYGTSIYTTNNGSSYTNLSVAATYSTSEWYVIVYKGKSSLSQTSSGTINGRAMSATASFDVPLVTGKNGILVKLINNTTPYVAEVIVYDSILSGANTTLVENYLKSKWAITY